VIQLVNTSLIGQFSGQLQVILHRASAAFPLLSRTAIICDLGTAKTTLSRMLQNVDAPNRGHILNHAQLSPTLGNTRGFNPYLSGSENVQLLARIMGYDPCNTFAFVNTFSALGPDLDVAVRLLPASKRAKIGYAFSYATRFPYYLAEDSVGASDDDFKLKCDAMLELRLQNAGLIFLTAQIAAAEKYANRFYAFTLGRLFLCASARDAFDLVQLGNSRH